MYPAVKCMCEIPISVSLKSLNVHRVPWLTWGPEQGDSKLCEPLTWLLCQCLVYFHIISDRSSLFRPWAIAGQTSMVTAARNVALFYSQDEPKDYSRSAVLDPQADLNTVDCSLSPEELLDQDLDSVLVHRNWLDWVAAEQRKRLGWAIVVR